MNNMLRYYLVLFYILYGLSLQAANAPDVAQRQKYKHGPHYIYRLYLADKRESPYSLEHASRYLSRRSIERRKRQQRGENAKGNNGFAWSADVHKSLNKRTCRNRHVSTSSLYTLKCEK